jgi:hypothetical protein
MGIGFAMVAIFVLFVGAFFAVGFNIVGRGVYYLVKSRRARTWPLVEGTIHACETETADGRVSVIYSYSVTGHLHQGQRIAFGYSETGVHPDRANHADLCKKLSEARIVKVRYNPAKPSESVLSCGLNRGTVDTLTFGLIWLFFMTGFAAMFVLPRADKTMIDRIEVREKGTASSPVESVASRQDYPGGGQGMNRNP